MNPNITIVETDTITEVRKRHRMPLRVNWICPVCGKDTYQDLADMYMFSYDAYNEFTDKFLYCYECNYELKIQARILPRIEISYIDNSYPNCPISHTTVVNEKKENNKMKQVDVAIVTNNDDWEGLYVNGDLIMQAHHVTHRHLSTYIPMPCQLNSFKRFYLNLDGLDYLERETYLPNAFSEIEQYLQTDARLI